MYSTILILEYQRRQQPYKPACHEEEAARNSICGLKAHLSSMPLFRRFLVHNYFSRHFRQEPNRAHRHAYARTYAALVRMSSISHCIPTSSKMWRFLLSVYHFFSSMFRTVSFFTTHFCYASLRIRRYFCVQHCSTLLFFYVSIQWVPREIPHSFFCFSLNHFSRNWCAQWQKTVRTRASPGSFPHVNTQFARNHLHAHLTCIE